MSTKPAAPYRSTPLGVLAAIAGVLLWIAAIGILFGSMALGMTEAWALVFLALPAGLAAWAGGYYLIGIGRQLRARSAMDVMANDTRPPVLFCRSFSADKGITGFEDEDEIQLAWAFQQIGPVVGIGRPGDRLRVPGAARRYIEGDDWMPEVEKLMDRSRLMIFQAAMSDGLVWEYQTALKRVAPSRIVIIPPDDKQEWQRFIEATGHDVLPFDTQGADMICLDTQGRPRLVWKTNSQEPWWQDQRLIQRLLFKSTF